MADGRTIIFITLVVIAVVAKLWLPKIYAFAKPLPLVFILGLAFLKTGFPPQAWLFAIGFGLLGDLLLLRSGGFVPGLFSFLVGHWVYFTAFYAQRQGFHPDPAAVVGVGAIASAALYYLVRALVRGRQKKYIVPLILYIVTTTLLVLVSLQVPVLWLGAIGVALFGFSDFLLAFNRFVRQSWYVEAAVLVTYYSAQWFLAMHFRAI